MKQAEIDALKNTVQEALRTGDLALLGRPPIARLVGALIEHHEATVRAEGFWGKNAPAMNEELLALRPLEMFARLVANGGVLSKAQRDELSIDLVALDRVRGAVPGQPPTAANDAQVITAADAGDAADVSGTSKARKGNKRKS